MTNEFVNMLYYFIFALFVQQKLMLNKSHIACHESS